MSKLAKLWSQVSRGSNNFQILEIQKRLHMMEEIMITNPKKKKKSDHAKKSRRGSNRDSDDGNDDTFDKI